MLQGKGMKARQFLNVVTKYGRNGTYSLSRIKPEEHLFYPSATEAQAAATALPPAAKKRRSKSSPPSWMEIMSPMLAPEIKFQSSNLDGNGLHFLPFYGRGSGSECKILCADDAGRTILYNGDKSSVEMLPCLNGPKGKMPISFSVPHEVGASDPRQAEALYVMHSLPTSDNRCNFEALIYSNPLSNYRKEVGKMMGWHWQQLPPPPAHLNTSGVKCHALLKIFGHPAICVSSTEHNNVGTYCFNTGNYSWTEAGRWTLPFYGRAEHVPELNNLWFGIAEAYPHQFCAMDLSSLDSERAPELLYKWRDLKLPTDWLLTTSSLMYLGNGRFCITKIFEFNMDKDSGDRMDKAAVLSGVEVVSAGPSRELRMIKHKSKFYNFINDCIHCVL